MKFERKSLAVLCRLNVPGTAFPLDDDEYSNALNLAIKKAFFLRSSSYKRWRLWSGPQMCAYPYGMAKHPHSAGYFGVSNLEAFFTICLHCSLGIVQVYIAGHIPPVVSSYSLSDLHLG